MTRRAFAPFDTKSGKELWTVKACLLRRKATPISYAECEGGNSTSLLWATGGFGVGAALASDSLVVFSLNGSESVDTLRPFARQATETRAPHGQQAFGAGAFGAQNHLPPGPGPRI